VAWQFQGPAPFRDRLGPRPVANRLAAGGNRTKRLMAPWLHIVKAWSWLYGRGAGCSWVIASGHNGNQAYGRGLLALPFQVMDPGEFEFATELQLFRPSAPPPGHQCSLITHHSGGRGLVIEKARMSRCWTSDD